MKTNIALIFALTLTHAARAEDATQFRGSAGIGVSKETKLPTTWSATEGVRWKAELPGKGLSNPVVANGRVYVTATQAYQQKRQVVLCFDVKTGKKLWERQVWGTGTTLCHPKTNMAAPTPITDGERVYALFATGDFVCYDKAGDLVWYRSLVGDYPTVGNNVGMAASPTISGDTILLCMENAGESFAAGIDKNTGENRWRIERPRGINWVTPIVIQNNGEAEVLFQGPDGTAAHEPATGKKKWTEPLAKTWAYASPAADDGMIFVQSDKLIALRPGKAKAEPSVLWQSLKLKASYCSPVAYQGFLYVVNGNGVLNCADAKSGEIAWSHRLDGPFSASPLVADGKLYVLNEKGVMAVLATGGKDANVLATNKIDDTFLASPVAADGAIFLRSDGAIYCIDGKKK
jgi:outer membrane protein assembly factor BamB